MTDDIFDYFSGNSNRKVEPIDDDEELVASSTDGTEVHDEQGHRGPATAASETESSEEEMPVAEAADEKVSHWDRLLGKLGITPAAKTTAPPKSTGLTALTAKEKSARANKRKEQAKPRSQESEPFGGIAAPSGATPPVSRDSSSVGPSSRPESTSKPPRGPKKSDATRKNRPAAAKSTFGMGILDEISTVVPEDAAEQGSGTLADLFVASEKFEPPFDEVRREIDDLEPFPVDDLDEPDPLDAAPEQAAKLDHDDVGEDAEFIEYEVQDLDFSDSDEERPRRPSRRQRSRRGRGKPELESRDAPSSGGGRRDQVVEDAPTKQVRSRRERNDRDAVDEDIDFDNEEPSIVEADSTPTRGRRRSRGRGRGRGPRESRPPRDIVDQVDMEETEFREPLEIEEIEEFDDQQESRGRNRGRRPRGGGRRPRQENQVVDDDEIDGDPYGVYDDVEPDTARGQRRRPDDDVDEDLDHDSGKRPQIPTWSEAVASMVSLNIKSRGSKPAGTGRGRGPRRPRRR